MRQEENMQAVSLRPNFALLALNLEKGEVVGTLTALDVAQDLEQKSDLNPHVKLKPEAPEEQRVGQFDLCADADA